MEISVIVCLLVILLAVWIVSVQKKLAAMDENINHSMNQIGVQISSRFDALLLLLEFTKKYAGYEAQTLTEMVKEKRCVILPTSTPQEVLSQEDVINEVLIRTRSVLEEYPGMAVENEYMKCMDAVECYEKMVQTSRLIYNDSVTKLNRELHIFPTSVLARMLGFKKRDYLVEN